MNLSEAGMAQMIAYEAFIRRASALNLPFMLKGSYVTRQYYPDPNQRQPNDLDYVYLETLRSEAEAKRIFDEWVIQVTESDVDDGVRFQSFREDSFWVMLEYAMAEDFPTVHTHLRYWVDGKAYQTFTLDITFNLEQEAPPVPVLYRPLRGEPFTIPLTVPLALQIAWKLHQTLVRPRFKDVFDLIRLLRHPTYDARVLDVVLQTLVNECTADQVDVQQMQLLIDGDLHSLFRDVNMEAMWEFWRFGKSKRLRFDTYEKAEFITDASTIPTELYEFLWEFQSALSEAGINREVLGKLPAPTRYQRKGYDAPDPEPAKPEIQEKEKPADESIAVTKRGTLLDFIRRLFG